MALAIGAIVGFERQHTWQQREQKGARSLLEAGPGVRTFALVALMGGVSAAMSSQGLAFTFPVALVALGSLLVASYVATMESAAGLTTEVAQVVVFLLGGLCGAGRSDLAVACAAVVGALLSLKSTLHGLTARLETADIQAALKLALVSVVVLPILPAEPWRPLAGMSSGDGAWWLELGFSPRRVWYLVVLISGVSFIGYALGKALGASRGIFVTALVGGVASSTATSLAFAQRSAERPDLSPQLAEGIVVANAVMPSRLLVYVVAVSPALALRLALPLVGTTVVGLICALLMHRWRARETVEAPPLRSPFRLGPAIKFGAIFAGMLLVVQVGRGLFGDEGLYAVSTIGGLVDTDAIALATADLVAKAGQAPETGTLAVALAVMSNTVFKCGVVLSTGDRRLRRPAVIGFVVLAVGLAGGYVGQRVLF